MKFLIISLILIVYLSLFVSAAGFGSCAFGTDLFGNCPDTSPGTPGVPSTDNQGSTGVSSSSIISTANSSGKVICDLQTIQNNIVINDNQDFTILSLLNTKQNQVKPTIEFSDEVKPYVKVINSDIILLYTSVYNYTIQRNTLVNGNIDGQIIINGDICSDIKYIPISIKKNEGFSLFNTFSIADLKLGNFNIASSNVWKGIKTYMLQTIIDIKIPFNNTTFPLKMWMVESIITLISFITIPFMRFSSFMRVGLFSLVQGIANGGSILLKHFIL